VWNRLRRDQEFPVEELFAEWQAKMNVGYQGQRDAGPPIIPPQGPRSRRIVERQTQTAQNAGDNHPAPSRKQKRLGVNPAAIRLGKKTPSPAMNPPI